MSIQCLKCGWLMVPGNMGLWRTSFCPPTLPNAMPDGNEFLGPSKMFG